MRSRRGTEVPKKPSNVGGGKAPLLSLSLLKREGEVIAVRLETPKIRDLQRGLYLKAKRENSHVLR
jgi:hypothetical protein